ncbi:peptidoglycan-binding protein [Gilliamella sp. BG2]|uniref:peptidoglycan-binding domain-containing protein n=1 Tax=Gilliamella sp. BG2 TaxID=3351509 RepID=UPI0039870036
MDLADYTPAMRALHQILTGTLIYSTQRKKNLPPPTFTDRDLKEGLRRSWTAELIGHLLVKYESEWYADEALSKWNEIDDLFEEEKQQQKELIEAGLDELGITEPYLRDFALDVVDEAHKHVKSNWQLEKAQRIKPSLWWQQVAQAQAQAQAQNQTTSTEQSDANTPKLTNLSTDGKAWFIHPVAMVDYFSGNTVLFKKGDKDEIIREINIRLAGFGGNVPTDEFTERTENMIKQFQRDYMQVEETGVVDMNVIKAIDEFSVKYDLPSNEWVKKPPTDDEQMFCPCGLCDGFGKSRHKDMYYGVKLEATHRYEYPGIHRSLLWALKAVIFYLQKENSVYSFRKISSGYRCYDRNLQTNRRTTNHKGKALDIHFNKNGVRTRSCDDMNKLRKDIFNKYLGAKWDWLAGQENMFNLESARKGATSWVHYDVRQFDQIYLKDEYFCKDSETLNGKPLAHYCKNS